MRVRCAACDHSESLPTVPPGMFRCETCPAVVHDQCATDQPYNDVKLCSKCAAEARKEDPDLRALA